MNLDGALFVGSFVERRGVRDFGVSEWRIVGFSKDC